MSTTSSPTVFYPPTYGAFARSNLFKTDAKDVQHSIRLLSRSRAKGNVLFEPALVYKQGEQPRGYIKASAAVNGFTIDSTIETDASKASSITVRRKNVLGGFLPGVNVAVSESTSERDFSGDDLLSKPKYGVFNTISADYLRNHFALTAGVTTDFARNHSVQASAAVGFDNVTVGGDVKAVKKGADGALKLKEYNAGINIARRNYVFAIQSEDQLRKIKATVLANRIQPDLTVGVQAKADLHAPVSAAPSAAARQAEVTVGVEYTGLKNTVERVAFVLPKKQIVASLEHQLRGNPSLSVGFLAHLGLPDSLWAPFPFSKLGVSLTFGEA